MNKMLASVAMITSAVVCSIKELIVAEGRVLPSLRELFQMGITFLLTVVAWVFFRSDSLNQAFEIIYSIITLKEGNSYFLNPISNQSILKEIVLILFLLLIEYASLKINKDNNSFIFIQIVILAIMVTLLAPPTSDLSFIYFQF